MQNIKYIYYYDCNNDFYIIKEYDVNMYKLRQYHHTIFLYNDTMVLNDTQIFDNLRDCVLHIKTKKAIMYNGKDINPLQPDVFIGFHNGQYFRDYHIDKNILKQLGV